MRKLTDTQRKLVEENHNLIYSFIHSRGLELDEYYGLVAESLCRTVQKWNEDRGSLSTYFYIVATNDLYRFWRKENTKKRSRDEIPLEDDYILEDYDLEDEFILKEILEEIESSDYGEIFNLRKQGYSQKEISDKLGISRGTVSRRLKKVGEEYFNRNG